MEMRKIGCSGELGGPILALGRAGIVRTIVYLNDRGHYITLSRTNRLFFFFSLNPIDADTTVCNTTRLKPFMRED